MGINVDIRKFVNNFDTDHLTLLEDFFFINLNLSKEKRKNVEL